MKVFVLVLLVLLVTLAACQRGILPTDPDLQCEAGYSVCFTPATSIDKTFPEPFYLKNLAEPISGESRSSRSGSALHYPGDVFKAGPDGLAPCCQGGNFGLTRARQTTNVGDPGNVLFVENGGTSKSEWRPDRIVGVSTSNTRRVEEEYRLLGDNTHLLHVVMTCIPAGSNCSVRIGAVSADEQVTIAGYQAYRVVLNNGTSRALNYHIVFRDPPTTMTTPAPDGLGYVYATYTGPTNTLVALVPDYALARVPSLFTQTDAHIQNATAAWQDWYRQFAPPSRCTTDWCRERYYRALTNIAFNLYKEYPGTPSSWRDRAGTPRWAMSPGAGYYGVWIWDSFFVAWMAVNNCRTEACVDTFMDSLRILDAHQYSDGQYPRQIRYATWDVSAPGTWQAPGGWSFAVDQADQRFGTTRWCTEFYDSLKRFHNYVRTRDSDGDNRFEWGGTNSGWDGSIRWDFNNPNEALDLNAWMILDAESLRNCAQRIRPADVQLWTDRLALYKTGFRGLCVNNYCYDRARTGSALSAIRTNAMYFGLLADAVTPSEATAMARELYNASTFGPNAAGHAMLPTVSRSDPGFTPSDTRCWSGSLWINTNLVAYLGLLRQGLPADADALRHNTMTSLQQSGYGYEHYNSANIAGSVSCFSGTTYAWTDAAYTLMAAPLTLPLLSTGCLPSWSCGAWGPWTDPVNSCGTRTRQCTDANACFPVRAETQTQTCSTPGGLVLWYPFDASEQNLTPDSSGAGHHGRLVGATLSPGREGSAANFDGIDDYVDTGAANLLPQGATAYTLAMWAYPRVPTGRDQMLVGNLRTVLGTGWHLSFYPHTSRGLTLTLAVAPNNVVENIRYGPTLGLNVWNFVAVRVNGTAVSFFVNAAKVDKTIVNATAGIRLNAEQPVRIGSRQEVTYGYYDGLLDDLRIYTRALSDQEIISLSGSLNCVDTDADGYSPGSSQQGCAMGDCDDQDAGIHPGAPELCSNSVDDDCDGLINEGCACTSGQTRTCGTDTGECVAGTETCTAAGVWGACTGSVGPTPETCDGRDNNCDGQTDPGCACQEGRTQACGQTTGQCEAGTQTCIAGAWGTCVGSVGPAEEVCNARDDDCDGATDEALVSPADCRTAGPCLGATRTCVGGAWTDCAPAPRPETCDAQDEDCDGLPDNQLTRTCTVNRNYGTQNCTAGAWRPCTATTIVTASAVNQTCLPDIYGTYLSLDACNAALTPPPGGPPPAPLAYYRCLDASCVPDPNGQYVTDACGQGCGPPPPPPKPKLYIVPLIIISILGLAILTLSLLDKANKR